MNNQPMTGHELRAYLSHLGLTQMELARTMGYTGRAVRHWVAGTRKVPQDIVRRIRRSMRQGYYVRPRKPPEPRPEGPDG